MTIVIVAPDPAWPSEFREIGLRLRAVLGESALRIDHIGSTAVPGLAAKDLIDIQVTVAHLDDVIPALEGVGFIRRDKTQDHQPPGTSLPGVELEKRLFVEGHGRRANVHIRLQGRFNQRYPLLCRDYLRTHPSAANAYAQIKRQLARYFPDDAEAYYDVKDPVFDLIMAGAEEWAQATNWQPGASDC
jgi:GrpB-like predicted nucleotidyltransferase (UPF0157 family)